MGASRPEGLRAAALAALLALAGGVLPLAAQVEADPVLRGRVLVGDAPLDSGTVVLHRITAEAQGEIDSLAVDAGGGFAFDLPSVPNPEANDLYFASVRHQGVLYFGGAVSTAVQLDSLYTIQAWDTLVVREPGGRTLPVPVRNVFLEPEGDQWRVTDLIQVRNDAAGTLVSTGEEPVWSYPLPEAATNASLGGDFIPGSTVIEDGRLLVHSALPPGERVFVIRYLVPDPYFTLELPGATEVLEVLVREPAPPVAVPGLESGISVELEPGSTYRRFSGAELSDATVTLVEGEEDGGGIPVRWVAVFLGLLFTGVGLWAVLGRPRPAGVPREAHDPGGADEGARQGLILEIARLDRDHEALADPTEAETRRYRDRRRVLLARLRELG